LRIRTNFRRREIRRGGGAHGREILAQVLRELADDFLRRVFQAVMHVHDSRVHEPVRIAGVVVAQDELANHLLSIDALAQTSFELHRGGSGTVTNDEPYPADALPYVRDGSIQMDDTVPGDQWIVWVVGIAHADGMRILAQQVAIEALANDEEDLFLLRLVLQMRFGQPLRLVDDEQDRLPGGKVHAVGLRIGWQRAVVLMLADLCLGQEILVDGEVLLLKDTELPLFLVDHVEGLVAIQIAGRDNGARAADRNQCKHQEKCESKKGVHGDSRTGHFKKKGRGGACAVPARDFAAQATDPITDARRTAPRRRVASPAGSR